MKAFILSFVLLDYVGLYAGKALAFEEFEARSPARRDVRYLVFHLEERYRRRGVSPAYDRQSAVRRRVGERLGYRFRAFRESGHLKDAHRAVPEDGLRCEYLFREELRRLGAYVESHLVLRDGVGHDCLRGSVGLELGRDYRVYRQK